MLTQELLLRFLRRRNAISIATLEREAGLPKDTVAKALKGERNLSEKHLKLLLPVVTSYGFSNSLYEKARVVSVINHKGGVGKTTTTGYLGEAIAKKGFKVLLIDLDPQGNLSQIFDVNVQGESQVYHSLIKLENLPIYPIGENLSISPSDIELARAETELLNKVGGEQRLKILISRVSQDYDFILIDCPPSLNILTMSAMQASNSCLITLLPEMSALKGLNTLLERISEARQIFNPSLQVDGIMFTMVRKNTVHDGIKETVREIFPNIKVFKNEIKHLIAFQKAQIEQISIMAFDKDSEAAKCYEDFCNEYLSSF
jgi:chromosome partitioning protein